jgi:hypothetical protein
MPDFAGCSEKTLIYKDTILEYRTQSKVESLTLPNLPIYRYTCLKKCTFRLDKWKSQCTIEISALPGVSDILTVFRKIEKGNKSVKCERTVLQVKIWSYELYVVYVCSHFSSIFASAKEFGLDDHGEAALCSLTRIQGTSTTNLISGQNERSVISLLKVTQCFPLLSHHQ